MALWVTSSLLFLSVLFLVPVLTEDSSKVNLEATDENGKQTDFLSPGTTVNLTCSYNVDPLYLNFYNGTGKNIYVWNFITGEEGIGAGFEKLVKSNTRGDGWMSIKFEVPYCYKDEVIKCTVLDQVANKHENKTIFPIGFFQKQGVINGKICDRMVSIQEKNKEFQLTYSVFGILPEANFTWSDGCSEIKRVSTEDTEKCFFDQTSTAICKMDLDEMGMTCSADNGIGNGDCTFMVTTGGGDDNTLTIVLAVTIPSVVIVIAAALGAYFCIKKSKQEEESPDENTGKKSRGKRKKKDKTTSPSVNATRGTGPIQPTPSSPSHYESIRAIHPGMVPKQALPPLTEARQPGQPHSGYSNMMSAHPKLPEIEKGKDSLPIYASVNKTKVHPCDASQPAQGQVLVGTDV